MGFKKDLKRAEKWLNTEDAEYPPGDDYLVEDAFCWDLIQRLNDERLDWEATARREGEHADYWREKVVELGHQNDNLRRKVEELAAEAAHWKTLAEADRHCVNFQENLDDLTLAHAFTDPGRARCANCNGFRSHHVDEPAIGAI